MDGKVNHGKFKKNVPAGFPYRLESKVIGKVITIGGADWSTYGISERGLAILSTCNIVLPNQGVGL